MSLERNAEEFSLWNLQYVKNHKIPNLSNSLNYFSINSIQHILIESSLSCGSLRGTATAIMHFHLHTKLPCPCSDSSSFLSPVPYIISRYGEVTLYVQNALRH